MPRTTVGSPSRSVYNDLYRFSSAYSDLRTTLLTLRIGECLPLPNRMTIERYSADQFNVRDTSKKLYARGEVDNILAYVTSSDEVDAAKEKSRRLNPVEIRENDVALARILSGRE